MFPAAASRSSIVAILVVSWGMGASWMTNQAAAELLARESFDYGTNAELVGQTGGTGFSGAWQSGPGNIAGGGTMSGLSADNTSLTYPLGTLLTSSGARYRAQPGTDDNDFVRLLASPINMATDAVHYFSFLGNKSDLSTASDFLIVGFNSNIPVDQFTGQLEARAAEIGWGSGDNILMATNPGGAYASSTLTGKQINKDMLFVLKVVSHASGNDEVFGHLFSAAAGDPFSDVVGAEPGTGEWLLARTMDSTETLDRIRIITGNNLGGQIDELRVGTTWNDVVAPDPAAQPQTFTWNRPNAGDWNDPLNWNPSGIAPSGDHEVVFGGGLNSASTVFTDANVTVRAMQFDSATSYGVAGQGALIFAKGSSPVASINVAQGSHEIQAGVNITSATNIQAASGTSLDFHNEVNLGGNTVTVSGAGVVNFNGQVSGAGSINSSATLGTGGATSIEGNLSSTGTLAIDIFGSDALKFDAFQVSGTATLSGILAVDVHNGFIPVGSFDVITAGTLNAAGLSLGGPDAGLFQLSIDSTNGIVRLIAGGLIGDYNQNGTVDAADYVVWRKTLGETGAGLAADGNGNNLVDPEDYNVWRANFGRTSGSGASIAAGDLTTAVPEPSTLALLALGFFGLTVCSSASSRHRFP